MGKTVADDNRIGYRKVASSRPVYYSIFDYFWGATNQDVLLTETCYYCYVQKSMKCWVHKRLHEFSSIFVDLPWLALFLKTPLKNVLKKVKCTSSPESIYFTQFAMRYPVVNLSGNTEWFLVKLKISKYLLFDCQGCVQLLLFLSRKCSHESKRGTHIYIERRN